MSKQPKKQTLPLFYAIYLALILVFILVLCFAMQFVKKLLAEYEDTQPKYKAQEVFEEYFTDFSYRNMREHFSMTDFLSESGYKTEEELLLALDALVQNGEMSYYRSSSGIADRIEYAVAVNKTRVAAFTLKKSGEKTKNGFDLYELEGIVLYNPVRLEVVTSEDTKPPTFLYTYRIHAPLSHTVSANGKVLTEAERVGEISYEKDAMASTKAGFEGIPFVTYELILDAPPSVTAVDFNQDPCTPHFDEKAATYRFDVTFDKALTNELGQHALTVAQKLGIYMQAGDDFSSIRDYYDPESDLYDQVRALGADAWMVKKFDSCEFRDEKISEAYRYTENDVSIRVSLVQICHRKGYEDSIDAFDYTFCFRKVEGEWLLYESYNN